MTDQNKALIWAAAILTTALIFSGSELDNGSSLAITCGLAAAAWASLGTNKNCGRSCLK